MTKTLYKNKPKPEKKTKPANLQGFGNEVDHSAMDEAQVDQVEREDDKMDHTDQEEDDMDQSDVS